MSRESQITLPTHAAIELLLGIGLMVTPLLLGFEAAAAIPAVLLGLTVFALALQAQAAPGSSIPVAAHAGFDYAVAVAAVCTGLALGVGAGAWHATIFLAGIAAVQTALTASTRFSVPLGAR